MGRTTKDSTIHGDHSTANLYLLKNRPADKYQLKVRLTIKSNPLQKLDCPVIYHDQTWRFSEAEFSRETNKLKPGTFNNGHLNAFNSFLDILLTKAVEVGDSIYNTDRTASHSEFRELLYDNSKSDLQQIESAAKRSFMREHTLRQTGELLKITDERLKSRLKGYTGKAEGEDIQYDYEEFVKKSVDNGLRKNLTTEEIYKRNLYSKNDIFEIFALTYYDDSITNEFYPKIVVRLFEYKERANPPSQPTAYNLKWIQNFFKWFDANGYYVINTVNFDPLNYDPQIFKLDKERKQYEGKSLQKMLNIIKDLSRKFEKRKLLPKVEGLEELRLKDFSTKKDRDGARKEQSLTKDEFDRLYHHKILSKDHSKYQEAINSITDSNTPATIDEFETARKMFICQVMFGGIRGWHDYKTAKLVKHDAKTMKVTFHVGKKDDAIENPLNVYTTAIIKSNDNKIPFIDNEHRYRALIKAVVRVMGFDRGIKKNKYIHDYKELSELFNPGFFARRTFAQMLSRHLRDDIKDHEIEFFTGHEKDQSTLSGSYLNENTIENKIYLLRNLKIG